MGYADLRLRAKGDDFMQSRFKGNTFNNVVLEIRITQIVFFYFF